jgi:hypothetical protein
MRLNSLLAALSLSLSAAAFGNGATLPLQFDFGDSPQWAETAQWIAPAKAASYPLKAFGESVAMFGVSEAGKSMKWLKVNVPGAPALPRYVVMRYRAENLANEGYLLWGGWVSNPQWIFFRPSDVAQDGQWHVIAADLQALGVTRFPGNLAVQVANQGAGLPAALWIDYIDFADTVPAEATLVSPVP